MSNYKKFKDDNKGFTLVELILTVVILALVTAPFLSSFVTAGQTNVKSKRRQRANHIGEYISERFKATDLSMVNTLYTCSQDPATGVLTYDIPNSKLPASYGTKYSATVKLTPKAATVNSDITTVPVALSSSNTAVFMADFYRYDQFAEATGHTITHRISSIEVGYDATLYGTKPYFVKLQMVYSNGSDINIQYTPHDVLLNYDTMPELYMFYTPYSGPNSTNNDKIKIVNSSGEKINIHLSKQSATLKTLIPANVSLTLEDSAGAVFTKSLADLYGSNKLSGSKYSIYTNVIGTGNLVQTQQITSLYDMEVVVDYSGKKVLTYDSSKNNND